MLSYRHGFHAGHVADVLKHGVFVFCLAYLQQKPKPLYVLDSHAGAGTYDLSAPFAEKTGAWKTGIAKVYDAEEPPELFAGYLARLRAANGEGPLRRYPGSPALAAAMLRRGDRLDLCDLHPADHAALEAELGPRRGVTVTKTDGWEALVNRLPPRERRGLVLIDPSYEVKSDYETAAERLIAAHKRFATGVFLLWYPVVDRARTEAMIARICESGLRRLFRLEFATAPDSAARVMSASGILAVNPPWTLPGAAEAALPWLAERAGGMRHTADWLAGE